MKYAEFSKTFRALIFHLTPFLVSFINVILEKKHELYYVEGESFRLNGTVMHSVKFWQFIKRIVKYTETSFHDLIWSKLCKRSVCLNL